MTTPILCGTDLSENARQGAAVAAAFASRLGAKLILAHSLDERGGIPAHLRPQLRDSLGAHLTAETARVRVSVVCVPDTKTDAG